MPRHTRIYVLNCLKCNKVWRSAIETACPFCGAPDPYLLEIEAYEEES